MSLSYAFACRRFHVIERMREANVAVTNYTASATHLIRPSCTLELFFVQLIKVKYPQ